jgi:hypothetical protein
LRLILACPSVNAWFIDIDDRMKEWEEWEEKDRDGDTRMHGDVSQDYPTNE